MELRPGSRVGIFEILAPIGAGGMGEVYRARDPRLDREVAIKILPRTLMADRESISRFEKEARSASALNHPNIVTIYEIGELEGSPYIVMELVDGQTLRQILQAGPIPMPRILRIANKIADGLSAAHAKNIVHRDLKPENVIVTDDGYVKIVDFGLAKLIQPADEHDITQKLHLLTEPGTIIGTVQYMSPEQAKGKPLDFHSDQFAFGSMLYEMVAGRIAFERDTSLDTLVAILHDQPPPLAEVAPNCPAAVRDIIKRCHAKEPARRYPSTLDLAQALRAVRNLPEHRTGAAPSLEQPHPRSRWRLLSGLALATLLTIAGGIALYQNRTIAAAIPGQKFLAVLPFTEASGKPGEQPFGEGIAEFVSSRLATIPEIQVMPPSASSAIDLKGDVKKIARQMGANLILRGIVQRSADRVLVSYSILNPERGVQVAADTFEGTAAELFALEDRVAESVSRKLKVGKPTVQKHKVEFERPADAETYRTAAGLIAMRKSVASTDEAIRLLEQLLAVQRDSPLVNATLGSGYLARYYSTHDQDSLDQALIHAERAAEFDPSVPETHITLGKCRTLAGRHEEAIAELNRALQLQPSSADAVIALARAHDAKGDTIKAERNYQHGIEMRPLYWLGYNAFGGFYFGKGKYDKAMQLFQRATQLNPDSTVCLNNLGGALQALGRYDEAVKSFQRSIAVHPSANAYSNLGTCSYYLGRYDDAATAYEKAREISANNYVIWANLGDAYRWSATRKSSAAGAYQRAIQLAEKDARFNPRDANSRATLAVVYAKLGDSGRAATELQRALELNPTADDVLCKAALVYHIAGDSQRTLSWLRRAINAGASADLIARDPEFQSLRPSPDFQNVLKAGTPP
jgi:eukaryotic-like serine/threonine-protein kinase